MADTALTVGEIDDLRDKEVRFYWLRTMAKKMVKDRLALYAFLLLVLIVLMAVAAPLISPHDPASGNIINRLMPPFWVKGGSHSFLLGTNAQGQDVLSRLIWGARATLEIGFLTVGAAALLGVSLGLLAGYAGGRTEMFVMQLVDIMFAFPGMLVALVWVMVLGPSQLHLMLALAFNGWMVFARIARGLVVTYRDGPMVEAAVAIGVRPRKIMFRHILPNIFATLVTLYVLEVARVILAAAVMSFLGYGVQPPKSSWGLMIGLGRTYFPMAWWLVVCPGIFIAATVLSLNVFANWFSTVVDPLQKGQSA